MDKGPILSLMRNVEADTQMLPAFNFRLEGGNASLEHHFRGVDHAQGSAICTGPASESSFDHSL